MPIEFLRGVLGLMCLFSAYMAGRAGAAVRLGRQKKSRLYAWILRTLVCAGAVAFRREADGTVIVVWVLAAALAGVGAWQENRPVKTEDLTHEIFPESNREPRS